MWPLRRQHNEMAIKKKFLICSLALGALFSTGIIEILDTLNELEFCNSSH